MAEGDSDSDSDMGCVRRRRAGVVRMVRTRKASGGGRAGKRRITRGDVGREAYKKSEGLDGREWEDVPGDNEIWLGR